MNQEANRLNTFTNWPSSAPVDPIRIAKAGFFYTGQGMEVQCFSCGGKISEWEYGDQVMWRHRRMEPNCNFVVDPLLSGNIPHVTGHDCPSGVDSSTSLSDEHHNVESTDSFRVTEEDEMYQNDALRLLTFTNWTDPSVSPEALASSGFYHLGEGRLRCAWCGGELAPFRSFGTLGPPLEVHIMYFPHCRYAVSLERAQRSTNLSASSSPPSYTPPVQSPPETNDAQSQSEGAAHNAALLEGGGTWRALGVVGGAARHTPYSGLAARLATFDRWPADRAQIPQVLAEAGFFYTGTDDQVRCFYCDGGLGKWEAGDVPWSEHAHWFPHCGYVLLIKGQEFVDACRNRTPVQRTFSADSGLTSRRRNPGVNFPITESQVEECMESSIALAALAAGLDAARVRRALSRRLRATDEQLNEEAWSMNPQSQRLARDILAETLRDFAPRSGIIPSSHWEDRSEISDSQRSNSPSPNRTATPVQTNRHNVDSVPNIDTARPSRTRINPSRTASSPNRTEQSANNDASNSNDNENNNTTKEETDKGESSSKKQMTLEEENRQLKEARLCKVCMDNEVSVVFLPCGHLVSCVRCGAALVACPLCRSAVRALVRAYLA